MVGAGTEIAAKTLSHGSLSRGWWLLIAAVAVLLLLLIGWLLLRFLRARAKGQDDAIKGLGPDSLVPIWHRFLRSQPLAARPIIGRYPWAVVLGNSGVGKTWLIKDRAGVQEYGQLNFPSDEKDPLLKIYLGRRGVIQELSPQLLPLRPGVHEALDALWRPLCRQQPPVVIVVLSLQELGEMIPTKQQEMGIELGKKLQQLSALSGAAVRVRVCLTHADALLGEKLPSSTPNEEGTEPLVELTHGLRVPLVLSLRDLLSPRAARRAARAAQALGSSQFVPASPQLGPVSSQFLKLTTHLRYVLPRLPEGGFDQIVRCMAKAPETLSPLETVLTAMVGPAAAGQSAGIESSLRLDDLYLIPRAPELPTTSPLRVRGDNPFVLPGPRPATLTPELHKSGLYGLWAALRRSNVLRTWHAAVCAGLIALALLCNAVVYYSHSEAVDRLIAASEQLSEAVHKAEFSHGVLKDSLLIRRAAYQTGQQLRAIAAAERFWPFLPRVLHYKKRLARQKFLESVRRAYLVPAPGGSRKLDAAPRSRKPGKPPGDAGFEVSVEAESDMTRSLYALAASNATRDNILGDLLQKNAPKWSSALSISERTLLDYALFGDPDCNGQRSPSRAPRIESLPNGPFLLTNPTRWLDFAEKMEDVTDGIPSLVLTKPLLETLKAGAVDMQRVLELVQRSRSLSHIADALEEDCDVNVRDNIGRLGWALLPPPWLVQNEAALSALVRLVMESELEPPKGELTIAEIAELMTALSSKKGSSNYPDRLHTVRIEDGPSLNQTFRISEPRWYEALAAARKRYFQGRIIEPEPKKPANGKKKPQSSKGTSGAAWRSAPGSGRPVSLPLSSGGLCGDSQPSPGLDARHTRLGYERDIKPTLLGTDKALGVADLTPAEKERVISALIEQTRRYAIRYREGLQRHFVSYGVRGDSPVALRAAVGEMLLPESSLFTLLRQVADNANLGELQGPYTQPLIENLAPFRPLIKLVAPKDGVFPELEPYRAILAQLSGALDSAGGSDTSTDIPLRDTLSGLGRLTLSMLAEEDGSPLLATQRWLDKVGVVPELRGPFLSPMRRALCLGTAELERALQSRWRSVREAQVRPLYSRFPFDRTAAEDVPLAALDVIHPKDGALWRFVRDDLAPFVVTQPDGRFIPKRLPGGALSLPPDLLPTLNHLGALSRRLWDPKEGTRRPLELRVRPQPLAGAVGPYAVTRAYLSVGSAAAVGYNQMPAERPLQVMWWNQENASVGIDLSTPDSPARHHASQEETRSAWSLLRLLNRGTFASDNVIAFQIAVDLPNAKGTIEVRFVFTDLPFAPFKPPSVGAPGGGK